MIRESKQLILSVLVASGLLAACGDTSSKKRQKKSPAQYQQNDQLQPGQNGDTMAQWPDQSQYVFDPASVRGKAEDFGSALRERISFTGIKGDSVPGYLYFPSQKINGRLPALMLQYGLGSDKDDGKIRQVAEAFVNKGYAILTIDIHGVGERKIEGSPQQDQNQQIIQFLNGFTADSFNQYKGDYQKAIDYLSSRNEIDRTRLAYGGASWGAITGAGIAADDPRIKAYVSIVGGGNFLGLLPNEHDPYFAVQRMTKPVFLINARNDEVIPAMFADALHQINGGNITKKWYDSNHTLNGVDLGELAQAIMDFLARSLQARQQG